MGIKKRINSDFLVSESFAGVSKAGVKDFPDSPGIYLMKDKSGRILYVGKASSLRRRIRSYFQRPLADKTDALLERAAGIDYIATSSSAQALLLENALIKRYKPYYNAALKDDKSFPYVKIVTAGDHPYLAITRGKKEKGAQYYGPYTNVRLLKSAIKSLRAIFPFCSCKRLPKKPCLYYHLKLCPGSCLKETGNQACLENLRHLSLFLEGRYQRLLKQLQEKMLWASRNQLYEQAAGLRDKISALSEAIAQSKEPKYEDIILELQKALGLAKAPYHIEAFDISAIAAEGAVGAMVSFLGAWPDKKNYRKFRIKTVQKIDDYAMLREVLRRRYGLHRRKDMPVFADLVMIDGGKGHLATAQDELRRLGLGEFAVIALAKRRQTLYRPDGAALNLPKDSKILHLLQRVRDEAHRFAISYHRRLRQKQLSISQLDKIAGIGAKRKKLLLRHFRSIERIKHATVGELLKLAGMDRRTAGNIVQYFSQSHPAGVTG